MTDKNHQNNNNTANDFNEQFENYAPDRKKNEGKKNEGSGLASQKAQALEMSKGATSAVAAEAIKTNAQQGAQLAEFAVDAFEIGYQSHRANLLPKAINNVDVVDCIYEEVGSMDLLKSGQFLALPSSDKKK